MKAYDFVIVGAGIIGLTVARELLRRDKFKIAILEKESGLGFHSSGRNSGVLHAGFYYSADSLKAKVCAEGSRLMTEYASEKKIPFKKTGKVVVTPSRSGLTQIQVLLERAKANGIVLEKVDLKQLKELEPEAFSLESALYSPNTAVIDSKAVLNSLLKDLEESGVELVFDQEVRQIQPETKTIRSEKQVFQYGHLINSAGLHADRIAHQMNVGLNYRILPFKGIYWKLAPPAAAKIRGSIYPVPDLSVPFLGVHLTRNVFDEVFAGPTAIPAFGRENYGILRGFELTEGTKIARQLTRMAWHNTQGMRKLIGSEMSRYSPQGFLQAVQKIAPNIQAVDLLRSSKVGLRAQLFEIHKAQLEMDFIVESGKGSTHVLNAISPAFSASLCFAHFVVDKALTPSSKKIAYEETSSFS